jgi:hypothetical protein
METGVRFEVWRGEILVATHESSGLPKANLFRRKGLEKVSAVGSPILIPLRATSIAICSPLGTSRAYDKPRTFTMKQVRLVKLVLLAILMYVGTGSAQQSIPLVVKFTGSLTGLQVQSQTPIGVTFALYKEGSGGAPLWIETQNVTADSRGRFSVLLGAASAEGLPPDLFASREARWLGMTPDDGVERPRVTFISVPYAFKAADSDKLGGKRAEEFVSLEQLGLLYSQPATTPSPTQQAQIARRIWCWSDPPCEGEGERSPTFEATSPTGPSFISDATTGPPFQVNSNTLVRQLNVDLLHGFTDSAFAKLNSNNEFSLSQQFKGGVSFPPISGDGTIAEPSSPQDFAANGLDPSSSNLITQKFRWQASGSDHNLLQPQFSLYFGSGEQNPQPTGFSLNSDGSINFATAQTFPGAAIMTAIAPLLPPLGGGGGTGGGGGGVSETPPGNQTITQPPGTSLNVNNLNNVRTVQAGDNWLVGNIATALTASVQATLTLTPCPRGVDISGSPVMGGPNGGYPVRIVDGVLPNNSESVYVTGGTCTSAAEGGTIIFTPYFSHAPSTYSIGSASAGIQEAINDACGTNATVYLNSNCHVVIPPAAPRGILGYDIYDTIYFHTNGSLLSGYGVILNCHGRGPCLQVGDLINSNDYATNTIEGLSFRSPDDHKSDPAFYGSLIQSTQRIGGTVTIQTAAPHNLRTGGRVTQMLTDLANYWGDVPFISVIDATHYSYTQSNRADLPLQTTPGVVALSYEAVLDNGNSTGLVDLQYENTEELGAFNHFFDFWDDENAHVEKFSNNAISLNQNANWTGSFLWSGGQLTLPNKIQQLAPVITVNNSSFTANGSNCATVYNSNGFYFQNSVCQAQGPWEFLVSSITGNYQGADFQNIYSEASTALNPASPARSPWPGLGVAGFIGGPTSGAGSYSLSGQGSFAGTLPTVGTGSTTYVYYIVARDVTAGTQTSPLPFMYEKENSPSQVTVQWPRVAAGTHEIVYDLIRNPAPQGTMAVAAGGYVAPHSGGCNGSSPSACGSVAMGLAQCSGFVCSYVDNTSNATSAYSFIKDGTLAPNPTFWPGTAVLTSTALQSNREVSVTGIAFNGAPTEYADYCSGYGSNVSGGYTVCTGSPTTPNNSVPDQPPLILADGGASGGGGVPGAKGRLIFETTATAELNSHQIITLYDSNPAKTQATTGHRPVGDPGDMYMGIDPNRYLMIGGGTNGITQYVNNIGDGTKWGERLTSSLKTFNVPVQAPAINATAGFQVNGSYGTPGQCLISTGSGSTWGSCSSASSQPAATDQSGLRKAKVLTDDRLAGSVSDVIGAVHSLQSVSARETALLADSRAQMNSCEDHGDCTQLVSFSGTGTARTSGSISFSSAIANGTCADGLFPWKGVRTSDTLTVGWPMDLNSGLIGSLYAFSSDTVKVRLCNFSGATFTPGTLSLNVTSEPYKLSGSSPLSFGVLPNGSCAAETFPLIGASAGAPVIAKWPSTLEAGLLGVMRASADDTIEIRLCNFSGAAFMPASQRFGASIAK